MVCHLLETCNTILLKEPKNIEILKTRAIALNIAQKYEEAIIDFIAILKLLPGDIDSYYLKSDCHYQLGEFEKAKQDFIRASLLENDPNTERSLIENVLVPKETELITIEKTLEYERNKLILKFSPFSENSMND